MHIEALAFPLLKRATEVAPKCLFRSLAVEKKIREFGKWRLRPRRVKREKRKKKNGEEGGSRRDKELQCGFELSDPRSS